MDAIYLDNNATTPMLPAVWEAMRPYCLEHAGNPASSHSAGRQARQALEESRERIAYLLDAEPNEVLFTSGATEANNLAIQGLCGCTPGHLLTSSVEHPSVAEPLQRLVNQGFTLTELPVTREGVVTWRADYLRADTRLVAVMLANHETGTIEPIECLASWVADKAPFHCDAAAAAGKMPISFRRLGVSSLTISAHKFHGPKGIGALIVKKSLPLRPLFMGGHQQHGKRPGTEPVPLAVGMAVALDLAMRDREANRLQVERLRHLFVDKLRREAAPVIVNGPAQGGVPHTVNLSFPGCQADLLHIKLDLAGVACSAGSACSSGSLLPSPVLKAMGTPSDALHSALRFSLSPLLTTELAEEAANRISNIVKTLRRQFSS
jgi:cysteine desulfurase